MPDLPDLQATLTRIDSLADAIGTRARRIGFGVSLGAVAAWALLLRRWVFDSAAAFAGWLPMLVALVVPGLVLAGFGKRMLRLGPAVSEIAGEAGVMVADLKTEAGSRVAAVRGGGGLRSLLGALRELGSHGERIRSLVADAAGTARVLALPYIGAVGLASIGAVVVGLLLAIGLVSLAF